MVAKETKTKKQQQYYEHHIWCDEQLKNSNLESKN